MARFQKGQSGNPAGRSLGSRNRQTVLLDKLMDEDGADVVKAVLGAAKGGDMQAARIILDRICPPKKGRPVTFDLPVVENARDVLAAISATVNAMAAGDITPDEASVVAGVLEMKRKAIETVEHERRLAAIEERLASK